MGIVRWCRNEWNEAREAARELWHFTRTHNWKKTARASVQRKYWIWWIVGIVMIVCLGLLAYYRDNIVRWFEPHRDDIVSTPASWVVPIAVLFILSFPPLGGHEVVILVIGLIWGLWIGFAITCAGTFLGEMGCYIMFRYFFSEKAAEIERESMFYACVARLMREGGLWIVIVVRFSAVPGHVVTAIQSTVGMSVWWYSIAVVASLPKQLAVVYLGVIFGQTDAVTSPENERKQRIISLTVLFVTGFMTIWALYIVYMRSRGMYAQILAEKEAQEEEDNRKNSTGGGFIDDAGVRVSFERRDNLAEATIDGDPGPFSGPKHFERRMREGGPRHTRGYGSVDIDVREGSGASFDPSHARRGSEPSRSSMSDHHHTSIEMLPGDGAWQDGQARRQRDERIYGERFGGPGHAGVESSFTHLPLQGSEGETLRY